MSFGFEEEVAEVAKNLGEMIGREEAKALKWVFLKDHVCPTCSNFAGCQEDSAWVEVTEQSAGLVDGKDFLDQLHRHRIPVPEYGRLAPMMQEKFGQTPLIEPRVYSIIERAGLETLAITFASFLRDEIGISESKAKSLCTRFIFRWVCTHCSHSEGCSTRKEMREYAGPEEGIDVVDVLIRLGLVTADPECSCPLHEIVAQKIAQGEGVRPEDEVFKDLGITPGSQPAIVSKPPLHGDENLGFISAQIRGIPEA